MRPMMVFIQRTRSCHHHEISVWSVLGESIYDEVLKFQEKRKYIPGPIYNGFLFEGIVVNETCC